MTTWEIPVGYPNILLVCDSDIYQSGTVNTDALQRFLASPPAGCPVSTSSHDYWIMHPRPNSDDGVHVGGGPPRGMVRMGTLPDTLDTASASNWLGTLAQEMGHAWLVPGGLTFGRQPVVDAGPWIQQAFDGVALAQLALLGRTGNHWASFLSAGVSPMDGVNWVEAPNGSPYPYALEGTADESHTLRRYEVDTSSGLTTVSVPGLTASTPAAVYSDLDLTIQGVFTPAQAYATMRQTDPGVTPGVDDLIPQWVGPSNYHAGLALVFAPDDVVVFGFYQDYATLGLQRTGQAVVTSDLSAQYRPWEFASRMYLRIVRDGNTYTFQARPELGNIGCLGQILSTLGLYRPPAAVDPYADLPMSQTASSPWITVGTITEPTQAPQAIGYVVKTWADAMPWVDVSFRGLRMSDARGRRSTVSTVSNATSPIMGADYASSLSAGALTYHRPKAGPNLRLFGEVGNLYVAASVPNSAPGVTPGDGHAEVGANDLWTGVDNAPKLVTTAPTGASFVVAGSVRIDRAILAPWAAGLLTGMHMIAYRYRRAMNTFGMSSDVIRNQIQSGETFKAAHIIIAAQRSDITDTMIANVDALRQASEDYFSTLTHGHSLNTAL